MSITNPGAHWAMKVTRKRWVPITLAFEKVKRATGYRFALFAHLSHRSWQRAVG